MKNVFTKLKGIAASVLFLALSLAPLGSAKAESPRFNYLDGDHPLIYGLNLTKNETERKTAVTGTAGDVFEIALYYHNGVVNTTAHNTKLKVALPTETINKGALLRSTLWADNADTVTADMTATLDSDASLEFVPGTLKWFPSYKTGDAPSALPVGQVESNLFQDSGINIGDVNGCWDYKGYILFQVKTAKILPGVIVQNKIAKNITTGETGTDIKANAGDVIEYTLTTTNTGAQDISAVISDDISDILEYADVTNLPANAEVKNGVISFNTNGPMYSKTFAPGAVENDVFKVKVKSPLPMTPESGTHFDFVMYNLFGNVVNVRLQKPAPGVASVKMQKDVRNFTAGEINFADEISAKPGDTLEYKISFRNDGQGVADSVRITDILPLYTQFMSGTTVMSINDGQEHTVGDLLTGDGILIGTLNPNDFGYIKFKVLTKATLADGEKLLNTANLKFGTVSLSDTALTKIAVTQTVTPVAETSLPKTGAESWILALLLVPAAYAVRKYLEKRKTLSYKIANY
ncbi:MAG: hypothetical protein WC227_02625 [Patescibacteria group bacterium]|jgi:uncharacterized repeat protein (TIGR01451 family)